MNLNTEIILAAATTIGVILVAIGANMPSKGTTVTQDEPKVHTKRGIVLRKNKEFIAII